MLEHEAPHARLLHHPNHAHADFLFDFPWQRRITRELAALLDSDAPPSPSPSPSPSPASRHAGLTHLPQQHARGASPQPDNDEGVVPARTPPLEAGFGEPALRSPRAAARGGGGEAGARRPRSRSAGRRRRPSAASAATLSPAPGAGGREDAGAGASPAGSGKAQRAAGGGGGGGHDRSDSASSYEAVVTRLRPMPHRALRAASPLH